MKNIVVLSGSVRKGRQTHKIAEYLFQFLVENKIGNPKLIDLKALNFPIFEERFSYTENPSAEELNYQKLINDSNVIIIVSPEYNLGIPASVKNAIDFLFAEWKGKKVGIATVTAGVFGARNVWADLVKLMVHLRANPSGVGLFFPQVQNNFDKNGEMIDKEDVNTRIRQFLDALI